VIAVALVLTAVAVPLAMAGAAQAQPTAVAVPQHDSPTLTLSLAGATDESLLVAKSATIGQGTTYFSGTGGDLADRGPLLSTAGSSHRILGVVGHTLGSFEYFAPVSTTPARYVLHQTNLLDGSSTQQDVPQSLFAYTGDGWLSYVNGDLVRYLLDGSTTTLIKGAPSPDTIQPSVDSAGALIASGARDSSQKWHYLLDLVEFGSGSASPTVERLADSADRITSVDLSTQTVAWATQASDASTSWTIHQRPRAGGNVETFVNADERIQHSGVQAGNGQVGYVVVDTTGSFMRVVTGSTAHDVALPGAGSTTVAVGDRFLTAVSGPLAVAGVYSVDGDTVSRVGTVSTSPISATNIAFSAGRLSYTDSSLLDKPGLAVWQRTVSGTTSPVLGAESLLPHRAYPVVAASGLSLSAGRSVTGSPSGGPPWTYQIMDRGKITATIPMTPYDPERPFADNHASVSGPYTLAEGKVYAPDGKLLYTRPGAGGYMTNNDDLFGSTIVWSDVNAARTTSNIWVRNVAKPKSSTNPLKLAATVCGPNICPQLVSIWGNQVAWTSDDTHIMTRTIGSTKTRKITATGRVTELELSENVVAWQIAGTTNTTSMLDVASTTSKPYRMAGGASWFVLDGHYLARTVFNQEKLLVYRLPFTEKYHPRLIGTYARSGFTPNGDGKADTWAPQYDASKPLTGVTLKIIAITGGKVLRTLTGTAPDGSIRDLVWNGKTDGGKALPVATYRWELNGTAADGDGALISPDGKTTITGTVKITATT
jgi:hypothetical protein